MNTLKTPPKIRLGLDALDQSADDFSLLGTKALIVSGQSMIRQGHMKKLTDLLDKKKIGYELFSEISGEPTTDMIEKGAALFKDNQCDFLIGFGGGSPMDAAKAIGVMVSTDEELPSLMGREIGLEAKPVAAIPTTAGTGSEVTRFTIITDPETDTKMLLKGDSLIPALAVIDPLFTLKAPESVTVSSALDALTHAIEAYTSRLATDQTDPYALSAISRIFKFLPEVLNNPEDFKAREELSIAAYEAGVAFSNSSVTLVHGMSRPIGALFHVPHGISNAMLLKDCLEYAQSGAIDRFARMAVHLNLSSAEDPTEISAERFLTALNELIRLCKVPTLKEYGIDPERFIENIDKMTRDAIASGSPANTRKDTGSEQIRELYLKLIEE